MLRRKADPNGESKVRYKKRMQSHQAVVSSCFFVGLIIIILILGRGVYNTFQLINLIKGKISALSHTNTALKKETDKMKQDNDFITNSVTEIRNELNQFTNNPNTSNQLPPELFFPYQSDIFELLTEVTLIRQWIQTEKKFYMRMIYKATLHGDQPDDFHSFCDKAESSLILIKDDEGNRFGGFTSRSWDFRRYLDGCDEITKEDSKAFVFNLDERKRYQAAKVTLAIECDSHFGPYFGNGGDIKVKANFLTELSSSNFPDCFGAQDIAKYELTKGKKEFRIVELEVFEIDFE